MFRKVLTHSYFGYTLQDPIKIHSVDLGISAPRLSRARQKPTVSQDADPVSVKYASISTGISESFLHVLGHRAGYGLRRHRVNIPLNLCSIQLSLLVIRSTTSVTHYIAFALLCHGTDAPSLPSCPSLTGGHRYA